MPVTTCTPSGRPELGGDRRRHDPDHRAGRRAAAGACRGRRPAAAPAPGRSSSRSRWRLSVSQARGHRRVRRGGDAGEPHRQVVDRLEVPARRARDLGLVVAAGAACGRSGRRRSWRARHRCVAPRRRAVAARSRRPARRSPARVCGSPRLSIQSWQSPTGTPCSSTGTVLAHCPVQLTATTLVGVDRAGRQRAARRVGDQVPPLVGVLDRAAARQPAGLDRAVVVPGDPAR